MLTSCRHAPVRATMQNLPRVLAPKAKPRLDLLFESDSCPLLGCLSSSIAAPNAKQTQQHPLPQDPTTTKRARGVCCVQHAILSIVSKGFNPCPPPATSLAQNGCSGRLSDVRRSAQIGNR